MFNDHSLRVTSVTEPPEKIDILLLLPSERGLQTVRSSCAPLFAIAILLAASGIAAAEEPIQLPHRNVPAVESAAVQLPVSWPILRDSAKIFSGTVLQVEHRNSDSSSALATTEIRFRVDQAIRGVSRGQVIEIK